MALARRDRHRPDLTNRGERFAGKRCLVTGGLGFIGSNLARRLLAEGAEVTVVDALVEGHGGNPANVDPSAVDVVVADVADAAAVAGLVRGADYLFDLAGQVSHIASAREPERDFAHNALARLRLLELVRQANPGVRAVYASTRQVYGRPPRLPAVENDPARPVDVNGIAKLAAEHLYLLRAQEGAVDGVVLRLTNVYGPRQRLDRDDLGVLPVFVRRALRGEPLYVFGDGSEERDVLHVDDAVEAFLLAALVPAAGGQVINVGGPAGLSLRQLAELTAAASPAPCTVETREWPAEHETLSVGSIRLSSELAASLLGWRARTAYADGISDTMAWFARHPARYR